MTTTKKTQDASPITESKQNQGTGTEVLNARADNPFRIFQSDKFGSVRTATMQGRHYFAATDVAVALGYKVPEKAIRTHCKGVSVLDTPSAGGIQRVNYISEPDLYRLVIRSKLPAAEDFADWVFEDVLPVINRTGVYAPAPTLQEATRIIDQIIADPLAWSSLSSKIVASINPAIVVDSALRINTAQIGRIERDAERITRQLDELARQVRGMQRPATKNYRIIAVEEI